MVYNKKCMDRVKNEFFTREFGTKALSELPKHRRFWAKRRPERGKTIEIWIAKKKKK